MNKQELQNKISEVEKMLCELKEELENMEEKEVEKGKIWKPKENEEYYYIDSGNQVFPARIMSGLNTEDVIAGNCYPTKEKAEFEANREKYTRLFRQYVEQHSEPLDWENCNQPKYYVDYYEGENFQYDYSSCIQNPFVVYASSKEVLQEAIDFIGEDNFKKYILEVKE